LSIPSLIIFLLQAGVIEFISVQFGCMAYLKVHLPFSSVSGVHMVLVCDMKLMTHFQAM